MRVFRSWWIVCAVGWTALHACSPESELLVCEEGTIPTAGQCVAVDAGETGADGGPNSGDDASACVPRADADEPDSEFVDANCDGIDGDVSKSVFVALSGSDDAAGSREAPVRTIGRAIELAVRDGKSAILVASGEYGETFALSDGVSVHGGYDAAENWTRRGAPTIVRSFGPVLRADDVATATRVTHLRLEAFDATEPGASAIGAMLVGSTGVAFEDVTISAGMGAAGVSPSRSPTGERGRVGSVGTASRLTGNCSHFPNASPTYASAPPGGAGGAPVCGCGRGGRGADGGANVGGGADGGRTGEYGFRPESTGCMSREVFGSSYGTAGPAGGAWRAAGRAGGDGRPGTMGPAGGPGGELGVFTYETYVPADGFAGGLGGPGGGGGGGGSGGFCFFNDEFCTSTGAGGGGGGSGGCGGQGGAGGGGGGASVALYLWSSTAKLERVELIAHDGGPGGSGARGGAGGPGGDGGAGGGISMTTPASCGGIGGPGGRGGPGGQGGSGGGGGGGPSVGLLLGGDSLQHEDSTEVSIRIGVGGAGGPGGPGAPAGQTGRASPLIDLAATAN